MSESLLDSSLEALVHAGMAVGGPDHSQIHILIQIMEQIDLLDEPLGDVMELSDSFRDKLIAYSSFYENSECTKRYKSFRRKGFRILSAEDPTVSDLFHFAFAFGIAKVLLNYPYCDLDDSDLDIDISNLDKGLSLSTADLFSAESIMEINRNLAKCCRQKSALGLITYIKESDFHSFF
jgi:hypothetical protein